MLIYNKICIVVAQREDIIQLWSSTPKIWDRYHVLVLCLKHFVLSIRSKMEIPQGVKSRIIE